jgi:membrane carboxypeptidase/penicillin-binding protein
MTEAVDQELAADIEAAIRAVPGVASVFRPKGVLSHVIDVGAQLLGRQDARASLTRVERTAEGIRVEAAIGVDSNMSTVETAQRVQAAIDALCDAQGLALGEIHVTVVHVNEVPSN